jgi:hypothetical protein
MKQTAYPLRLGNVESTTCALKRHTSDLCRAHTTAEKAASTTQTVSLELRKASQIGPTTQPTDERIS